MAAGDRDFCDLVMQGGLTSGVVYPTAVLELSHRYSFKNIGGTSAGAIAAAATAAAELGRRRAETSSPDLSASLDAKKLGMAGLAAIAKDLATEGFIYRLFQPVPAARPAFDLLVAMASKRPEERAASGETPGAKAAKPPLQKARSVWLVIRAVVDVRPFLFAALLGGPLLVAALAVHLAHPSGLLGWVLAVSLFGLLFLLALLFSLAITALVAASSIADAVRGNFMGLCSGRSMAGSGGKEALTDWMHRVTCELAGNATDEPVLFEHLWDAPLLDDEPEGKTIRLAMITTDASHQQPRTLPDMSGDFWYCEQEFEKLFPDPILRSLKANSADCFEPTRDRTYRLLPEEGRLPIVVAARMSLSFPMLISAIPLYQPDWTAAKQDGGQAPEKVASDETTRDGTAGATLLRSVDALAQAGKFALPGGARALHVAPPRPTAMLTCWFTDGGASSNFPLDLFDAPVPRWPTFAIDLVYPDAKLDVPPDHVALPMVDGPVAHPRYVPYESESAIAQLGKFLFGIIATMQTWRDRVQERAPGQRDRVASIFLTPSEGGINLNMGAAALKSSSDKGTLAGHKLAALFNFANHRQIRTRVVMSSMQKFGEHLSVGLDGPVRDAGDMSPQPGGPYPLTDEQRPKVERLESCVKEAVLALAGTPSLVEGSPMPHPALKITPTF